MENKYKLVYLKTLLMETYKDIAALEKGGFGTFWERIRAKMLLVRIRRLEKYESK